MCTHILVNGSGTGCKPSCSWDIPPSLAPHTPSSLSISLAPENPELDPVLRMWPHQDPQDIPCPAASPSWGGMSQACSSPGGSTLSNCRRFLPAPFSSCPEPSAQHCDPLVPQPLLPAPCHLQTCWRCTLPPQPDPSRGCPSHKSAFVL